MESEGLVAGSVDYREIWMEGTPRSTGSWEVNVGMEIG